MECPRPLLRTFFEEVCILPLPGGNSKHWRSDTTHLPAFLIKNIFLRLCIEACSIAETRVKIGCFGTCSLRRACSHGSRGTCPFTRITLDVHERIQNCTVLCKKADAPKFLYSSVFVWIPCNAVTLFSDLCQFIGFTLNELMK